MERLAALWLVAGAAQCQVMIAPGGEDERKAERAIADFTTRPGGKLDCAIEKYPPRLGFSLRFWTGYDLILPARQFAERGPVATLLRVTPKDGSPVYFYERANLPPADPAKPLPKRADFSLRGGFLLGEGEYDLALYVVDAKNRVCRQSWKVEADAPKGQMRIEPGRVAESEIERWRGIPPKASTKRVSIFLHAAPVFPRRNVVRLSSLDISVLTGSLTSLLDTSEFAQARVTAFGLDGRDVIFESSDFDGRAYRRLVRTLIDLNLGTVSYGTLKGPGPLALIETLARKESAQAERADAVVFLGATSRYSAKLPPLLKELRAQLPPAYFVTFRSPYQHPDDLIHRFVRDGGGKTYTIFSPGDLASAIREISRN